MLLGNTLSQQYDRKELIRDLILHHFMVIAEGTFHIFWMRVSKPLLKSVALESFSSVF